MSDPQKTIEKFQRRQHSMPFILGGLAVVLVVVGLLMVALWITNPASSPIKLDFLATETPTETPTNTHTPVPPTNTPVPPTLTHTPTDTPTITPTPTISGPFYYTVKEGDTLTAIAAQFGVSVLRIMDVNNMTNETLFIGVPILIPDPNEPTPTLTPLPANLPKGFKLEYRIQPGDSLSIIALRFNSTEEEILKANDTIKDANAIFAGQVIIVPVNIVTPAPTRAATATQGTPGAIITLTPSSTATP